ncbi:major facilitator superfamily domain-containing protein [Crucibulum laeve]|uniref:Major facilitator superfamily domain-containing protein n=1 Tax=Crucibulum laeve TaxID=68775 RepID=A0A5C3LSW6_9AGAR|nr:major facilitator superfamily domain-containing protein [Crucibulum laeve]
MASEETPLLATDVVLKHETVYQRFSPARKRFLVAMVSWCGLMPLFVSGTFVPSIPQIAKDLNSTGPIVSLAVSLSVLAASLGGLVGASYSTFYGRRPIYLVGLPLLFIGSMGVASAKAIPALMIWRFIQALGAAPGMSVGAGVIGDIYRLEERGQAMGIYFAACLLGPALAPLAGGIAAHYSSWRVMQFALGGIGLGAFIFMSFFFPETSHPGARGVDKLEGYTHPTWRPVLLNPLSPLWLLRSPNLLAVSASGLFVLLTDYVLLIPLAYTIGVKYNITNEALIGACFIPCGVGNMIGAPLAGRISDRIVVRWREKRGGVWYPEDRLRATLSGALIFVPLSVLISGLLTEYVPGRVGLTLNLVCLFMNGIGVDIVLSPSAAYNVDVMHARSAESMAANTGFRSIMMSVAIAGILPMIETYGVVVTNTCAAILGWIGFGLLWLTIRYGESMRAWVNIGYSTAENN